MPNATALAGGLHAVPTQRPLITHTRAASNPDEATRAAAELLNALGLDLTNENLAETPRRMAHALIEMTTPREFEFTTFPNTEAYDELVLVQDIPFQSLCEHHMLPFVGKAHVGYLPGERILGLSKFARMMELHSRQPQTQERMTKQIADHLDTLLQPRGVGVVIEAEHTCMSLRGARANGALTTTSTLLGQLREDQGSRAEFMSLTRSNK